MSDIAITIKLPAELVESAKARGIDLESDTSALLWIASVDALLYGHDINDFVTLDLKGMLSAIRHESLTYIANIQGCAQVLTEHDDGKMPLSGEMHRYMIDSITKSVLRLRHLVMQSHSPLDVRPRPPAAA